jgi:prephenate dehydrogenase/chorismate mutase/prephenate dehydrogenase
MIPEKLKLTDERLIELLRDRLTILAESGLPTFEEQISSVAPLLAQFGVPEFVWKNTMAMSCLAVLSARSSEKNVTPQKITVIGGRGRMGKLFAQQLSAAGHNVSVLGNQDWEYANILLGEADLVLISVPIERTVDVIQRAAEYLAPTTALADITSIKTEPVQTMLEYHIGPVMGLHPMFGPSIKSFSGQKVVVCPGRQDDSFQWLLQFIASKGAELIVCTPEEHDWIMVIVQATRHFSRFSLGVFLAAEKIDIDRSLSMSSPSYRQEIDIVNRLFAQSPSLCVDIMLATEERCQAIEKLANTYSRLAQLVAKKDRAALIQEFETTQSFFKQKSDPPLESNYAIATFSS